MLAKVGSWLPRRDGEREEDLEVEQFCLRDPSLGGKNGSQEAQRWADAPWWKAKLSEILVETAKLLRPHLGSQWGWGLEKTPCPTGSQLYRERVPPAPNSADFRRFRVCSALSSGAQGCSWGDL